MDKVHSDRDIPFAIGHTVMPLTVDAVLRHPSLQRADPIVRSAVGNVRDASVRWVHSSEVLDIAPLLRGGEFLLTGGVTLASASGAELRRYVTDLAERGVAALAVETGGALRQLPKELLETAEAAGLPVVELRRVVPFVEVAQEINSRLVSESVVHLQQVDQLSHLLSQHLASGDGLGELVRELATTVRAPVTLTDQSGRLLAAAAPDGTTLDEGAALVAAVSWTALDVPVRGIVVASLRIGDAADGEIVRLAAARAVDALSLALVQYRPPKPSEIAANEFLRQARDGAPEWRLERLARAAGLRADAPLVGIAARPRSTSYRAGQLDQALQQRGRRAFSLVVAQEVSALVHLPGRRGRVERTELVADLRDSGIGRELTIAVGPLGRRAVEAPRLLTQALLTLDLASGQRPADPVHDSEVWATERLATQHLPDAAQAALVDELLGDLLQYEADRGVPLLQTLDRWLASGCSTTGTSRVLMLRRQSLHHRLQRIFELLGGDPRESGRLAGLQLAVRLAVSQREARDQNARYDGSSHPSRPGAAQARGRGHR